LQGMCGPSQAIAYKLASRQTPLGYGLHRCIDARQAGEALRVS